MPNLKKVKKWLIKNIADIRVYKGGVILFGDSHYKMRGPDVRYIMNVVRKGDVLLRSYDHYLGAKLTPGFYSHAAIYVGAGEVVHMLGEGITVEDILTFCRCDHVAVLRCDDESMVDVALVQALTWLNRGVKYDYEFESDDDEFYCTEFVWECYGRSKELTFDKYLLPDDFLMTSLFSVIARRPDSAYGKEI
jgi:hypothetical protein